MEYSLSIITPTLNAELTLQATLDSVMNLYESGVCLQHIIVDGGSTDSTIAIIAKYQRKASYTVDVLPQSSVGVYSAMNQGIKSAKGKYIHILNSDDILLAPYMYKALLDYCASASFMLIASGIIYTRAGSNQISRIWPVFAPRRTLRDALGRGFHVPHPGLIVHKSVYELLNYNTSLPYAADLEFITQALSRVDHIYYAPLFLVGMNSSGISSTFKARINLIYYALQRSRFPGSILVLIRRYLVRVVSILHARALH